MPDGYHVEICWILRHGVAPKDDVAGKYVVALPCHEHDLLFLFFLPPQGFRVSPAGSCMEAGAEQAGREESAPWLAGIWR